jgi:hypothetical protein
MKTLLKTLFLITGLVTYCSGYSQCGVYPSNGSVTVNATNVILNSYYPGVSNATANSFVVEVGNLDLRGSSTAIAPGDLVLIIQMQGANINTANTDQYGDGVAGGSANGNLANTFAGQYEYNTVFSVTNGATTTIVMQYALANNYYQQAYTAVNELRTFQVIRIPRYYDLTIAAGASVTAPAWNGNTGGVIVLDAANTITLNGSVTANGKGFRGGGGKRFTGGLNGNTNGSTTLARTDYRWNSPVTTPANTTGGAKGEGIAGTPAYVLNLNATAVTTHTSEGYLGGSMGRGAPGNAGGGGTDGAPFYFGNSIWANEFNTGGGGGGNGGNGGNGGSGWHGGSGNVNTYPHGGHGGAAFNEAGIGKLVMGGGGGAGTGNQSISSDEFLTSGACGGGIILIRARSFAGNGNVNADGASAHDVQYNYNGNGNWSFNDGAGGGGAGGTILIVTNQAGSTGLSNISASARGGNGGNMRSFYDFGPGGGGGGGIVYTNGTLASVSIAGGSNGRTRTGSNAGPLNNDYGATSGANGRFNTLSGPPVLYNRNSPVSLCGVLPIKLSHFEARQTASGNLLHWIVSGGEVKSFKVEYSLNGTEFQPLADVEGGRAGTFYYLHYVSNPITIYYRLIVTELNQNFFYSKVVQINIGYSVQPLRVYVNNAIIHISYESDSDEKLTGKIVDVNGRILIKCAFDSKKGRNLFKIQGTERLSRGMYFLQLNNEHRAQTVKLFYL